MSETSPETVPHPEPVRSAGGGRRKRRRASGCIPVLLVLAVLAALLYVGVSWGKGFIEDHFGDPEDYAGPGKGSVTFQVQEGDSIGQMGRNLEEAGVVASVEAFTDAASGDPDATGIQVGFYPLKKEMKASDVLAILTDPARIITTQITFPEGLRVVDIVELLVKNTDFSKAQFEKALDNPDKLGLPDYAGENPEGYLFPSTYAFGPDATPATMVRAMVDRWRQAAEDADLEGAAERLGYTPQRADDRGQPRGGRGPWRRHAQDRPGDLQPDRERRHGGHHRPAAAGRDGQLRARPRPRSPDHGGGPADRLAVEHLPGRRTAAHAHRGTGRGGHAGGGEPGGG